MKMKTKVRYLSVKELEDRIKERKAEAKMHPDGPLLRDIMSDISELQAQADAKRMFNAQSIRE
jgi:hypothetical protein